VLLAVAIAINGAGGFTFWWLAAWRSDVGSVGGGQELFVALTVAVCVTSIGLPVYVAHLCSYRSPEANALFGWSVLYSSCTSVVGAAVLLVLVPDKTLEPLQGLGGPVRLLVLVALVIGMSLAVLVEVRLMALRRWGWVLGRVVLVVGLRLPLLWWQPDPVSRWFVFLAAGAPALSGVVGAAVLLRASDRTTRARVPLPVLRAWFHFTTVNYASLLGAQAPLFLIPFLVSLQVDHSAFASFYIAWAVTQTVFAVPHMMGQTYLVEAAKPAADPEHQLRLLLGLSVGVTAAVALGSVLAGRAIGWSLGPDYDSVATLLPWLVAGCVPWAVTSSLLARARHLHQSSIVVGVTAWFAVASVGCILWLSHDGGVMGAAHGWVVANLLTAALAVTVASPVVAASPRRSSARRDLEPTLVG
jgi:O-antigen/teichoic acid export membrane protein